jgi:hypothetical protein
MKLSKYDANLLTREEDVFIFISKKFVEIDFEIENEMLVALRHRISDRCNKDMMWLMSWIWIFANRIKFI